MFKLTFEINGRPVQTNQLANAFEKAVFETVRDQITRKLSRIRCPDHGSAPTVVATGRSVSELTFKVSGCCQKLIDQATTALR
jgi:hypothetical protein